MIPPALALLGWPIVGIWLVGVLGPVTGTTVAIFSGILILPPNISYDLPLLPPISKHEIAVLSALLGLLVFHPRRVAAAKPGRGIDLVAIAVMAGAFGTALTNGDPLPYGGAGLSAYDGLSMAVRDLLSIGLPFVAGRIAHRSPPDLRKLVKAWFFAGLVLSLFTLFEVRMGPQLLDWIYGYRVRAGDVRWGAIRPKLMMENGLALSLFTSMAVVSAAVAGRALARRQRSLHFAGAGYLALVLVLSRSLASMTYGVTGALASAFARARVLMLIAVAFVAIGISYPVARSLGVFSGETVVDLAAKVSADRAQSFEFRLVNEDALIEFTKQRPLFGYGAYKNRNRFFNEKTRRRVIIDGYWVILLSARGVVGLSLTFALLTSPVLRAWRRLPRVPREADRAAIAGVALMNSLLFIDLLPNGLFTNLVFYVAGALWGSMSPKTFAPRTAAPPPAPETAEAPAARRTFVSLTGRRRDRGAR